MVKSVINTILIAEDDADDRFLLGAAFQQNAANDNLVFVENGVELFDFLKPIMIIIIRLCLIFLLLLNFIFLYFFFQISL